MPDREVPKLTGEPIPLNLNPLNQLAKKALNEVKADADPYLLYSLQLAQWVLDDHLDQVPEPASQFGPELTEATWKITGWDPLAAQAVLLLVPENDSSKSEVEFAATKLAEEFQGQSRLPEQLGARLVDHMWMNLKRSVASLRPASL